MNDKFEQELLVGADVRSFIELLQKVFDEEKEMRGLKKSDLARMVGKDPSYVSRVLSGRQKNLTIHTLALFMRVMGRRLEANQTVLSELKGE